MQIRHLIDGRAVESKDYFPTVNPATQEVLAEVARGTSTEVDAAVAAAKAAFPRWAATPAPERAALLRKLGDLITSNVGEIAQTETRDTGQPISQTAKQLVPRSADNFHYFAEMCVRVDGHTYPTPTHLNYTLVPPRRGVRAGVAVERAVHDLHLEGRARAGVRQYGGAEDERIVAAHRRPPRGTGARGRDPARRAQRRPRLRRGGRGGAVPAPGRPRDLVHGLDAHRQPHRQDRRPQEILDGARRQEPLRGVRRRESRACAGCGLVHDFFHQRRALHRGLPHPGAAVDLCGLRREVRGPRAADQGGRSSRRQDHHRPHDKPRAPRQGAPLHRTGPEGGRDPAVRRPGSAGSRGRRCARGISSGPRYLPTWTTGCASRRRRSSARSPA